VNGVDAPQAFDLSVGTRWTVLGGTPPIAAFVTTVRDFVLMGKIGTTPQRVQWSGINNANLWGSVPANQADIQDLPDGGNVTGLVGGEYALIFQETSVRRMTYEGPPIIFRIDKIANDIGCSVPGSLASLIDMAFFCHKSGFYMVQGGQTITPIGRGKIDRTFWAEFDETNQFRASSAIDPVRGLYIFAYPANGNGGVPNRLLIYNWRTGKWAHAQVTCELVFGGVSQQSYTLEQLDPFGALDALPYSLDSSFWTGTVSLLLFAFAMSWVGALVGLMCRTVEVAQSAGLIWLFPLTFVSSAFVPTGNMPAVLKVAAEWNPVTAVADASRELFANAVPPTFPRPGGWPGEHSVLYAVLSAAAIIAVFAPLTVARYRRLARR